MQSFFIGIGAVIASALPYILTNWLNIANIAPAGEIPDSVKFSFYIGGAIFFLAVLFTVLTTKEYSPQELKKFSETESVSANSSREHDLNALLDEFNITRLRKTPSIALSGGERRRCEIARALASRPNYMLLDEPFAGIDPIAVGDLQVLVRHLTNRGIGVLITDHNVRETLGLTDRAYIIYSGEVLMEGSTDDIVNNPEVRRLYLGEDFSL